MIKREAKFTVLFRHWLMANPMWSAAFELKQTTNDSLPFSAVQEHQLDALLAVSEGAKGLLYKAPDDSRGVKPMDLLYLRNADAYVVIKYPEFFCLIDVDAFIKEKEKSNKKGNRKSLTSDRAQAIAYKVIKTK